MAIIKRANVEMRVPEDRVPEYLEQGYSEIDSTGKVIQQCEPQTLEDYKRYVVELKTRIAELEKAVAEPSPNIKKSK